MQRQFLKNCRRGMVAVAFIGAALVATISTGNLVGQDKEVQDSTSKVKIVLKASKVGADGKQMLQFELKVDKGWYIYANPVGLDLLDSNATKVVVKSTPKLKSLKVEYPEGKLVMDNVVGNYMIYQGDVKIKAYVQRAEVSSPLEVTLRVNSCNKSGICLPPGAKKFVVK